MTASADNEVQVLAEPARASVEPLFRHDLPVEEDPIRLLLERRVPWAGHDEIFSHQLLGAGPSPDQGWKLHVSATPLSAVDVLEAALDVLLPAGARFKVVGSIKALFAVNSSVRGVAQVGKFITVYPGSDDDAVSLAVALDAATRGHRGPRVPTDRALAPASLVHYRYGAFRKRPESKVAGTLGGYDLLDGAGRLSDDVRLEYYEPPEAPIVDPFEAAGVRVAPAATGRFLNNRYFVSDLLSRSGRGGVFRAIDVSTTPARLCLVKEAWHDVGLDPFGRDARDWAANEERVLTQFADDPVFPRFYNRFEVNGDRYMAIEFVEGKSLDKVLSESLEFDDGLDIAEVISIGLATADALTHLHDVGLVFRDLKPANLVKTPDGGYRLIDYGIAHHYQEDTSPPLSIGTPPFYGREQYNGDQPHPTDDVFAWGAMLFHLAGGNASWDDMPTGDRFLEPFARRPMADVRPGLPTALAAVIDRAVAWKRDDRYASMAEARDALADASRHCQVEQPPSSGVIATEPGKTGEHPAEPLPELGPDEALTLARQVGDALLEAAEHWDLGQCWKRRFEVGDQSDYSPDLYAGTAGTALFLVELARDTGDVRYADAARDAARWLTGPSWTRGRAQHGFQHGEGGVAYFFLRLAELLDLPGYVTAAELRLRRLLGASSLTNDLLYGTAGTALGLLALHAATGDVDALVEACQIGDELVRAALAAPNGAPGCYWDVPSSAPGGRPMPYFGLLHGSSGIALVLAHLGALAGDDRYTDVAIGAAELLLASAKEGPAANVGPTDEAALSWSTHLGGTEFGLQSHCHGAGGIAQFFLSLDRLVPDARYRQAARGGALTVAARRATESRSAACHGLSGTGHLMLDSFQAFGDQMWLTLARECGSGLDRFRVPDRPGVYTMHDDVVSPDLMVGYAGVGSFLLRLANPATALEPILGPLNNSLMK